MDIQSILSLTIQVIFMGFVSLIFVDFANGFFWLPYSYSAIAPVATNSGAIAATPHTVPTLLPIVAPESELQFAQLPSPWDLDTDITPNSIPQPVVLEFPTLKLLPPVISVVKPKAKATTKSTKSTQPKSTKTSKTSKPKTAVTPRKSRKKAAA
ncbi:hypothetical protein [Nostoc sp. FACHB-190]|uniref:hypothetical protein n=1 Tax=Nostoc sp. FACHB-190 TaxID=2692838 RepID=UPI0016833EBD|nr:hypothetical protein [Nostoc sp. FACHB-190]MBD2302841.1 hypothetical protein [Nostoc sp. FACHB-190]